MPSFTITKSVRIQAPLEKVYATIRDFRQWPRWSPWLICEPGAQLTFREDGRGYAWNGEVVGSGTIEIATETPPHALTMQLEFLKPFRSQSGVGFTLRESEPGQGTEVIWTMDGSLPFFLFFLKGMMTGMLGSDYERGLRMLKVYLETGSVPSHLEFAGREDFPGGRYAGIRVQTTIDHIGPSMEATFATLAQWAEEHGIAQTGPPVSIYHRWNFSNGRAEYTSGIQIADEGSIPALPPGASEFRIPAGAVQTIRHTGPYEYLGNAWAAAMTRANALKWRRRRNIDPFEVYLNDPKTVPGPDLVTAVHIPVA